PTRAGRSAEHGLKACFPWSDITDLLLRKFSARGLRRAGPETTLAGSGAAEDGLHGQGGQQRPAQGVGWFERIGQCVEDRRAAVPVGSGLGRAPPPVIEFRRRGIHPPRSERYLPTPCEHCQGLRYGC